jgi:hypothetical protein
MLPAALRQRADVAGSGELLWPRAAAQDALRSIAGHGLGVLAVEAYGRLEQARGAFRRDWPTEPAWQADEPWPDYVARAAAQAAEAIAPDELAPSGSGDDRRYFIAVCGENEYPQALKVAVKSPR